MVMELLLSSKAQIFLLAAVAGQAKYKEFTGKETIPIAILYL
jgi:hypothetical protein